MLVSRNDGLEKLLIFEKIEELSLCELVVEFKKGKRGLCVPAKFKLIDR